MWQRSAGACCQHFLTRKTKLLNINHKLIVRRTRVSCAMTSDETPPTEADVVICGGGVMGAAVAYHLAMAGWGERTVLVESSR